MKEPKRYNCGNGEGMFEDDKNGHWVEYSEHEAIVKALKEQCNIADVVGRSEQLPSITLEQAIAKAKPNLDKITDVDKHLDDIR